MSRIVFGIIVIEDSDFMIKNTNNEPVAGSDCIVVIACSTGGPKALHKIVPRLPKDFPVPVLIVQHMADWMTGPFSKRLNDVSEITVKEAAHGEALQPGTAYVAKGGLHLTVAWNESGSTVFLDDSMPIDSLKPSADKLFESLVDGPYDKIICVVLTGMGQDGTVGIKKLSESKNTYVIAQDEASCTVYGMPKAVYQNGLANVVCDLNEIAEQIIRKVGE